MMDKLTEKEKETLHLIARSSVEASVRGVPSPRIKKEELSENLLEKRGAFVTLKRNKKLRGCIGIIFAIKPLYITVKDMARAAALEDPRFFPIEVSELKNLEIEISALTPMERIKNIEQIEVGKHGLYLKRGRASGLLLPQVPGEYGWDRQTFLEHTAMKANLPSDVWKYQDTEIYIFSAEVF